MKTDVPASPGLLQKPKVARQRRQTPKAETFHPSTESGLGWKTEFWSKFYF